MAEVAEGNVPEVVFTSTSEGVFAFQLLVFGDDGPATNPNTGDVLYNVQNAVFHGIVRDSVQSTPSIDGAAEIVTFESESNLIENNWRSNPNGESYLNAAREAGYGRAADWVEGVLRPEIEAVHQRFAERYG